MDTEDPPEDQPQPPPTRASSTPLLHQPPPTRSSSTPLLHHPPHPSPPPLHQTRSSPSLLARRVFRYVNIYVSGHFFKTLEETLQRFPDTLLGNPKRRQKYWDAERNAFVFHRCRQSFESILYFYQSGGSIIQPINVEQDVFLDEAKFFKLPLLHYFIPDDMGASHRHLGRVEQRTAFLDRVHTIFQDTSTIGWKALALFDVGMTFVFVSLQCLRTERSLRDDKHQVQIVASESMCIVWFLGIFCLRLLIAPVKKQFIFQFMSVVDIAVILTWFIDFTIFVKITEPEQIMGLITILRLTGFLRLFNMARYSELLFCLGVALKRSLADLAQVMVLIFLVTFIFATLAYYIEEDNSSSDGERKHRTFTSVFDAFYWGTITIATVGYGDIYPKTPGGKSVGAALALLGLPLIAIPMPLIMSKFDGYYRDVKRKKENDEVRDKIMEDLNEPGYDSECDENNGALRTTWDSTNGNHIIIRRSTTSLIDNNAVMTPGERAALSWSDVIKDGYGFALRTPESALRTPECGGLTASNNLLPNSRASSRVCLSFSDLSRIFNSVDTVNYSGAMYRSHGDSLGSLPSFEDHSDPPVTSLNHKMTSSPLNPMVCYQKVPTSARSQDRLDVISKGAPSRGLGRRASTGI